jgi:hypothetical protein
MSQRNLVRLVALLALVVGLLLAVQAWGQTQQNRGASQNDQVRFQGRIEAGADAARLTQDLQDLLAGTAVTREPIADRTSDAGLVVRPLSAERLNVAIAKPNGKGGFEVICEDGPTEARASLNRSVAGR